jgi:hypothetical protein
VRGAACAALRSSGEACLSFRRDLGVLKVLLPLALLASACQCLGNA